MSLRKKYRSENRFNKTAGAIFALRLCACIIVQIKDISLNFTPCFNGLVYFITHHTTFVKHIGESLNVVTDSTVCTNYSSIYCMGMDLSNVLRMLLHGLLFVSLSCSRCDLAYDIASDLTAITHTHTHVRTHTSTHQHIQLFCGIFLLKFPPFFFLIQAQYQRFASC